MFGGKYKCVIGKWEAWEENWLKVQVELVWYVRMLDLASCKSVVPVSNKGSSDQF